MHTKELFNFLFLEFIHRTEVKLNSFVLTNNFELNQLLQRKNVIFLLAINNIAA
jgi:hypothetical protein